MQLYVANKLISAVKRNLAVLTANWKKHDSDTASSSAQFHDCTNQETFSHKFSFP